MSKFTLHMTIVDASQRSRPRLFQPQFLLEGFQRLAGSLNGLGRSVFRLLSCYRAVLQEGGTSILSRPCAFFRHCCCSAKPVHLSTFPIVCSHVTSTWSKTSTAHVSALPRTSNLLSTFAQAPDPSPSLSSSPLHAREHLP